MAVIVQKLPAIMKIFSLDTHFGSRSHPLLEHTEITICKWHTDDAGLLKKKLCLPCPVQGQALRVSVSQSCCGYAWLPLDYVGGVQDRWETQL